MEELIKIIMMEIEDRETEILLEDQHMLLEYGTPLTIYAATIISLELIRRAQWN